MWIVTTFGFFSIVEKEWDRDTGTLTVRARVADDLMALKRDYLPELGEVAKDGTADYRFRAQVPRAALAAAMPRIVQDIDYDNFKNAVAERQGWDRERIYARVWTALLNLQKGS